jgi:hypothetical protein
MTFILPSFGASAISAVPGSGGGGGWSDNTWSLSLDGLDDYVEVADTDDFSFGDGSTNSAFSYSFWVRVERSSSNVFQHLISKGSSSNSEYLIQHMPPNSYGLNADSIYFALYPGSTSGAVVESPASSISLNTWHHVVCTADGTGNRSGMKIYIDGISQTLRTSGSSSLTMINSTDPLRFGARSSNTTPNSFLQGKMDEIALFNTALSASQITNIYRGEDDGGSGGTNGVPGDLSTFNSNNGPAGWWRMGDNSSGAGATITDQGSGGSGGNNGTIVNGSSGNTSPAYSTDVPVAPLSNSYALEFDGLDDYVTMGAPSSLDITGDMTLSIWAKFTNSNSSWMNTIYKGTGHPNNQFNLYHRNDTGGTKNLSFQGSSGIVYALTAPVSVNTWHHIAVVVNSGVTNGTTIYVDGNAEGTGTVTVSSMPSGGFYIGNRATGNFFEGLLDEAAIFNYALNSTQLAALRDTSGGGNTPADISSLNPVGWWRMGDTGSDYGTATITNAATGSNSGGSSINGTIVNGSSGNTSPTYHDLSTAPDSIYVA